MTDKTICIQAINIDNRLVLTTTGAVYPMEKFYDIEGVECEPDDAVQVIAGCDECWFTFDPRDDFEKLTVH